MVVRIFVQISVCFCIVRNKFLKIFKGLSGRTSNCKNFNCPVTNTIILFFLNSSVAGLPACPLRATNRYVIRLNYFSRKPHLVIPESDKPFDLLKALKFFLCTITSRRRQRAATLRATILPRSWLYSITRDWRHPNVSWLMVSFESTKFPRKLNRVRMTKRGRQER